MLLLQMSVLLALGFFGQAQYYDFDGPSTTVFSLPFFFPFAQTIAGGVVSADTYPVTADATIQLSCRDASCAGPRTAAYIIGTKTIRFRAATSAGWHCPISGTSVTCTVSSGGTTTTRTDNIGTLVPLSSGARGVATAVSITSDWNLAAPLLGLYGGTTPRPTVFAAYTIGEDMESSIGSVISASIASASLASATGGRTGSSSLDTASSAFSTSSSALMAPTTSRDMTTSPTTPIASSSPASAPAAASSTAAGKNSGDRLFAAGGILGAAALLVGAIVA